MNDMEITLSVENTHAGWRLVFDVPNEAAGGRLERIAAIVETSKASAEEHCREIMQMIAACPSPVTRLVRELLVAGVLGKIVDGSLVDESDEIRRRRLVQAGHLRERDGETWTWTETGDPWTNQVWWRWVDTHLHVKRSSHSAFAEHEEAWADPWT